MKKKSNSPHNSNLRGLTHHTLSSLHLPHNGVGERVIVGFSDDGTYVEVEFWDGRERIGLLSWECGASDDPIKKRFARQYIAICRQIPAYCANDIRTLYKTISLLITQLESV